MDMDALVAQAQARRVSDIHIVCGLPVRTRIDGQLVDFGEHVLTHDDCEQIARELCGTAYKSIEECGELDFARTLGGFRCRLNVFRQQGHASVALRILSDKIPLLDTLGVPDVVETFPTFERGIVVVTGETGSGKSTTLAALIDAINRTRRQHIVTLEDPIEYIYTPQLCTINQRQIGTDTRSYADGLRAILREDPDIILIGEMRDVETIEAALTAAETGHLVFATLHTNSAPDTIDRIVDVFPGEKQPQIRLQLAMTLKAVLAQQLLPHASGTGRVLATEVMVTNDAIKNLIREGKTPQIMNTIQTTTAMGNQTMDGCLARLVHEGKVSREVALGASHDAEGLRARIGSAAPRPRASAAEGGGMTML